MNNTSISNQTGSAWMISVPAAAVGAFSIGTRALAGAAALGLKTASIVADRFENKEWSETFDNAANASINFATRSIVPEVDAAIDLTIVAGIIFLASQVMPKPGDIFKNVSKNNNTDSLLHK